MDDFLYNELNKAWKTTCKVLFKEEIGELKEYEEWLSEYVKPAGIRKDKEGNDVYVFPDYYEKNSNYISFDKVNFFNKFEPLNINEVKDIDSIVEALKERFVYAGNIVLGKSNYIKHSTNIIDSFFVLKSWTVGYSKYIAFSNLIKNSENIFGTLGDAESLYTVKNIDGHKNNRVFECYSSNVSSDLYYTSRVDNSNEVMFSFGLKGVHYAIGNREIEKSKYYKIKNSLIEQIVSTLLRNKRVFSLLELMEEISKPMIEEFPEVVEERGNKFPIKKAFEKTTKIIFKKELKELEEYNDFLMKYVNKIYKIKSAISQSNTYLAGYIADYLGKPFNLDKRSVKLDEIRKIAKNYKLSEDEVEKIGIDKESLKETLKNIAFISVEAFVGNINNVFDAVVIGHSRDCYHGSAYFYSKFCSHCFWPRESEYIFGSDSVWSSKFSIHVYKSTNIQRAFEVDNCQNSSDIYFSHNVENVIEGMFNFNVKNLNYAIGNAKYEREKYMEIKESLLEQIANELEEKKDLKWNIYNIGKK